MDILNQLKSVYTTLDTVTISGSANIDKMCGCFYMLGQIIQKLELQKQAVMDENDKKKTLSE